MTRSSNVVRLMLGYYTRLFVYFFFSSRRRHTRFDCDWSSDVCSSDLGPWTEPRTQTATRDGTVFSAAPILNSEACRAGRVQRILTLWTPGLCPVEIRGTEMNKKVIQVTQGDMEKLMALLGSRLKLRTRDQEHLEMLAQE